MKRLMVVIVGLGLFSTSSGFAFEDGIHFRTRRAEQEYKQYKREWQSQQREYRKVYAAPYPHAPYLGVMPRSESNSEYISGYLSPGRYQMRDFDTGRGLYPSGVYPNTYGAPLSVSPQRKFVQSMSGLEARRLREKMEGSR